MWRVRFLIAMVVFLALSPAWADESPSKATTNKFALALFDALPAQGNLFFSPLSVSTALGLACEGAGGTTRATMLRTLDISALDDYARFVHKLGGFEMANALWVDRKSPLLPSYVETLKQTWDAEVRTVDFSDPAGVCRVINSWVSQQTQGKIQNLIEYLDPGSQTDIVLTNAICFKGTWRQKFDPRLTASASFYCAGGKVETVQMMHTRGRFDYYKGDRYSVLSLPYENNLAMEIILPDDNLPLAPPALDLSAEFVRFSAMMRPEDVAVVELPRFKMSCRANLNAPLSRLGLASIFARNADFSGMFREGSGHVDKVCHQAVVEVDEQGTTAAAATSVSMSKDLPMKRPIRFIVNRPFIFLIVDRPTMAIVFAGRMEMPQ